MPMINQLPEFPSDLFELRAHAHDWNINTLDRVLAAIADRASSISTLQTKLARERSEIDDLVDDLASRLRLIEDVAKRQRADSFPSIVMDVGQANKQLTDLRAQIDNARQTVQLIAPLKIDADSLKRRNTEFTTNLNGPRQKLAAMRGKRHAPESWKQLKAFETNWVGYLDYVAGLCFLHDVVDGGISAIANALIAELVCASTDLDALAIPGRGTRDGVRDVSRADAEQSKVVYLGFPEWTVWALPLAAHELWHIARDQAQLGHQFSIVVRQKLASLSDAQIDAYWRDPLFNKCIADAFATYTMGPSYAYAALVLALDPVREDDRQRAWTILRTLQRVAGRDELNVDTTHVDLARLWKGALEQAEHPEVEVLSPLVAWLDVFLEYLDRVAANTRNLRFDTKQWTAVREDLKQKVVGQAGTCDRDISLRFVLTAAWEARIEQPERFGAIADRCAELCRDLKSLPPMPRPRGTATIPERPDLPN